MRSRGFTLVELVMVIAVTGILAASLTVFLRPTIEGYVAAQLRGELTDMADTALRRMAQDIRRAVPNSIIPVALPTGACIQLVPTTAGGRYRRAADTVNGVGTPLDTSTTTAAFHVLSPMTLVPAAGDWVVVDNGVGSDVYNGFNRAAIDAGGATTPMSLAGQYLVPLAAATQFPSGYDGGRFVTVSSAEPVVGYSCPGDGNLYRNVVAFGAAACGAGGAIVASNVGGCAFSYTPGAGGTQQNGFVWMVLTLSVSGETVTLAHGAHVDNSP